jgi:hypothetical protein
MRGHAARNMNIQEQRGQYPLYWTGISILVVAADYFSGPVIQFPIAYVIPVLLATWYSGLAWGVFLAVLLSLVRVTFYRAWTEPFLDAVFVINLVIRLIVFVGLALLVNYVASLVQEIKVLKGILPICSNCKKIRMQDGTWSEMEEYISQHSEAEFSHGLCQQCAERMYPRYFQEDQRPKRK